MISYDRLVLVGPSRQGVMAHVRELAIPPLQLERRGVRFVSGDTSVAGREDQDRLRGLGATPWAAVPEYTPPIQIVSFLQATLRCAPGDFHELIARHLAWRIWHDC